MDFLKSQFDRIQQQINGLNASQKMLTASLVAVMVLTLMFWGRYAGQSEMAPVLDQSFTDDELQRILSTLDSKGIEHRVSSDKRVLVPAESRISALAYLGYDSALPKSTVNGFDDVIKKLTPWDGQDKQGQVFNHGKQLALERVIGGFPGVAAAQVFIDPRSQRMIGHDIEPTATVNIQLRDGGKPGKQLVNAAANLVVGAQAGLALNHVKVIVDGALYPIHVPNPDDEMTEDALDRMLMAEKHLTDKLQNHLSYIEGVRVSVTVHVNNASAVSDSTVYDKNKTIKEDQETTTKTREESGGAAAPAGEAGAGPNISLSVSGAPGGGGRSSTETTETVKNFIGPSVERKTTKTPAGEWAPVGASVRVPRSYFVNVAKAYSADGKVPDAAAVNKAAEEEMAKIRQAVLACTGLRDVGDVSVETYSDVTPVPAAPVATATASPVAVAIGGHTKEIVLGALALVSLFMMSMIVKKGTPATPVPVPTAQAAPAPRGPSPLLERGEMLAGDVAEASPLLDGMELDDDAVKTQQMLVQVSNMVGENPDAAATLVKRWLNRT